MDHLEHLKREVRVLLHRYVPRSQHKAFRDYSEAAECLISNLKYKDDGKNRWSGWHDGSYRLIHRDGELMAVVRVRQQYWKTEKRYNRYCGPSVYTVEYGSGKREVGYGDLKFAKLRAERLTNTIVDPDLAKAVHEEWKEKIARLRGEIK